MEVTIMNNHSQMSEDKIEQTRQKIYEIREVIWAYEEKKKDVHQAVEEICKIINSIPNIILDDELKKYCCSVFENAKKNPNLFSVIIKKILSVICLFLNPKENTKILKDTEHHIRLKDLR